MVNTSSNCPDLTRHLEMLTSHEADGTAAFSIRAAVAHMPVITRELPKRSFKANRRNI